MEILKKKNAGNSTLKMLNTTTCNTRNYIREKYTETLDRQTRSVNSSTRKSKTTDVDDLRQSKYLWRSVDCRMSNAASKRMRIRRLTSDESREWRGHRLSQTLTAARGIDVKRSPHSEGHTHSVRDRAIYSQHLDQLETANSTSPGRL